MGRCATKAKGNMYYEARINASKYDERLKSRESAATLLNLHEDTLRRYECNVLRPAPETNISIAELYNAPEVNQFYCNTCPLREKNNDKVELNELTLSAIKIISDFKNVDGYEQKLIDIVLDGVIDDHEINDAMEICNYLTQLTKSATEMKLSIEKKITQKKCTSQEAHNK